jgi:hypothetical protein
LFQYGLDSWGAFSTTRYTDTKVGPEPPREVDSEPASIEAALNNAQPKLNGKNAINLEFIHNNVHVSNQSVSFGARNSPNLTFSELCWRSPISSPA